VRDLMVAAVEYRFGQVNRCPRWIVERTFAWLRRFRREIVERSPAAVGFEILPFLRSHTNAMPSVGCMSKTKRRSK
jgi:hypothetical protein